MNIVDIIPLKECSNHHFLRHRKIITLLQKQNYQCNHCSAFAIELTIWYNEKMKNFNYHVYGIKPDGREVLFTLDHIIPKSKGGGRGKNLQVLCKDCNTKKGDKIITERKTNESYHKS